MPATLETRRTAGEDPVARALLTAVEAEYETPAPAGGPDRVGGYAPMPDHNGNRLATFWGEKAL